MPVSLPSSGVSINPGGVSLIPTTLDLPAQGVALKVGVSFPAWLPLAGGAAPAVYADFAGQLYWYNGSVLADWSAFLTALSGTFDTSSSRAYTDIAGLLVFTTGPRFDYDPVTHLAKGMLLEGARTNLVLRSAEFDNASWTKQANNSITADQVAAPDGNTAADKILAGASTGTNIYTLQAKTLTASQTYSYSLYGKEGTGLYLDQYLYSITGNKIRHIVSDLANGVVAGNFVDGGVGALTLAASGILTAISTWYRPFSVVVLDANTSAEIGIAVADNTTSAHITSGQYQYLWGAQLEQGTFPSSYIPTTSASATRTADSLTAPRSDPATISKVISGWTPAGFGTTQVLWQIDDGSENNRVRVYCSSGALHVVVTSGGTDQCDLSLGTLPPNAKFSVAFRAGANNFAASLNGLPVVTDTSGSMPTGLVNERWAADSAGNQWFGTIATDAEFSSLASSSELVRLSNIFTSPYYLYSFASGALTRYYGDGINFTPVTVSYTPDTGSVVGDPSVVKIGSTYWLAHTITTSVAVPTSDFDIASSSDGITWTYVATVDMTAAAGGTANSRTWAPEWFVDSDNSVHILVSCSPTGDADTGFQFYEVHPTNGPYTAWSSPVAISGAGLPNNMIDATVIKVGSTYNLWYKNENTKYIEYASSTSLTSGYTVTQSGDWAGWGSGIEGAEIIPLGGSSWRIFFDRYLAGTGYAYSDSANNFSTWTVKKPVNGPIGTIIRHGSFVAAG